MVRVHLFTKEGHTTDVPLDRWRELTEPECSLLWVDARSVKADEMEHLAEIFGLHAIAVASCLDGFRRPHLYEFPDHFYVNLTTIERRSRGSHGVKPAELNLFAGHKFLITVLLAKDNTAVDQAIEELSATPELCARGPMYAVYRLVEDLAETYTPVVERLDDEADTLETDMLDRGDQLALRKLFHLKRQVFDLRKLLGPQRDIFNELARRDFPFITGEQQVYFQDVYNRMVRVFDMLDTIREILSGSLDIYLSTVSNRLNEVMKVLTVFATILMMLSVITGFYGMNFRHLPFLSAPHAFWYITGFMATVAAAMLLWFRRKGWL